MGVSARSRVLLALTLLVFAGHNNAQMMGMKVDDAGTTTTITTRSDEDVAPGETSEPTVEQQSTVTALLKEAAQESKRNVTFVNGTTESGFMPSFHLGPIGTFPATIELPSSQRQETKTPPARSSSPPSVKLSAPSNFPFNNVRTIKFDNGDTGQNKSQQSASRPTNRIENFVKFVEQTMQQYQDNFGNPAVQHDPSTNHRYSVPALESPHNLPYQEHHHQGTYSAHEENPAQFVAQWSTAPDTPGYRPVHHQPAILSHNTDDTSAHLPAGQVENHPLPDYQSNHAAHYLPLAHPEAHYVQHLLALPHEAAGHHAEEKPKLPNNSPEMVINVHPISFQSTSLDGIQHPKTVIYVTHDAPHGHWQPYRQISLLPDSEHHFPPVYSYHHEDRGVSPWKKILHIIGTFLPLGLLVALLSPRVISTENNGEANIILSKLRVNDLQAEHKQNRLPALDTGRADVCEERSVCRLLAAADSLGSAFLRHLMLRITDRTTESAVRKKELDRIFEAAKLGKCDILTCNFYDGT